MLPLEGDRKPVPLLRTPFNEGQGSFSPDGRWIAYTSNESGRGEIYARPFISSGPSGPSFGEGKWQISKDGGTAAKWHSDGKEIIFHGPTGAPLAVDVTASGSALQIETPKQLFMAPNTAGWDVSYDGKRFLMIISPGQQNHTQTQIIVVLNWQAALRR